MFMHDFMYVCIKEQRYSLFRWHLTTKRACLRNLFMCSFSSIYNQENLHSNCIEMAVNVIN